MNLITKIFRKPLRYVQTITKKAKQFNKAPIDSSLRKHPKRTKPRQNSIACIEVSVERESNNMFRMSILEEK